MSPSKSKATQRIQFAYYAYLAGPMGDVFEYLLKSSDHSTRVGKRMGIKAISAFWKPFSAQTILQVSEQEMRKIALNSIAELEEQIELIKRTFNLQNGDTTSLTRQEIEQLVDVRMSQHVERVSRQQKLSAGTHPIPDNYNERKRRNVS